MDMKDSFWLSLAAGLLGLLVVFGFAATRVPAGVVIPSGPEHRDLHSAVIFKGAVKAGDWVTLDIQAVQTGDFIQYIGAIIVDCDDAKDPKKHQKPPCPMVGEEVNSLFTQTVQKVGDHAQIQQLVDLDLSGSVFLATILKR